METAEHIAALRDEGNLLAEAAGRARRDAPVPTCPGWQVRDLVRHTGFVHRWATDYVVEQHQTWVGQVPEAEILASSPPGDGDLLAWFREGHARLVSALGDADPAMRCWTFLTAPSPLGFWARRQAHETTIHRVDAQLAAGAHADGLDPVAPSLAADGIDELIMGFGGRTSKRGLRSDPPAWLAIHATDADGDWLVRMGTDAAEVTRGPSPGHGGPARAGSAGDAAGLGGGPIGPDASVRGPSAAGRAFDGAGCELTGPAADLYLFLWNRAGRDRLELTGDPRALDVWRQQVRVRWS